MKREQFTWYRSYYEALKTLPAKDFKKAVLAVCAYALDEETPNLDGVPNSVFTLIRPTLDSGRIKAANRANKARTKQEQNGNKPEQTAKENEEEKEEEKESESESENDSSLTPTPLSALCASSSGVVFESGVSEGNAGGAPPPTPPAERQGAKKAPDVFAEFAGENAELLEALRDFEKMRKSVKKPLTDRAKKMLTNNLRNNFPSELWIPVLDQSIKKCWLDVYPLKEQQMERAPLRSGNIFLERLREGDAESGLN